MALLTFQGQNRLMFKDLEASGGGNFIIPHPNCPPLFSRSFRSPPIVTFFHIPIFPGIRLRLNLTSSLPDSMLRFREGFGNVWQWEDGCRDLSTAVLQRIHSP